MTASFRDRLAHSVDQRVYYGWVMVAVASVGLFASGPGQSHTFSVFITPIADELAMSRTSVSSAYSVATLIAALGLVGVGRLIDRFGVWRVLLSVVLLLGLAAVGFGRVTGLVTLSIGFAALRLLGQGAMMLNSANLISQWFSRKRGLALSFMSFGFALSVAVHPSLAQWLIEVTGWRDAWLWLGVATWLLMLPLVVVLVQDRPERLGLHPDGRTPAGLQAHEPASSEPQGSTLRDAMRTSTFWIMALGLSALSMLVTGLFFHQVSIFETQGLSAQLAARVFPVTALVMLATTPVFGYLLDRLPTPKMFAAALLTMTVAMVAMALVSDLTSAVIYTMALGLTNAGIQSHFAFLWPRYFGRKHLGSIQGAGQTFVVIGAAVGPLPFGIAFDWTGSYAGALLGFALLPVGCAVLAWTLPDPERDWAAVKACG